MKTGTYSTMFALALALLTTSCASLAPAEQRKTQWVETTTQTKATAYNRTLAYLSKNLGDSNHAVKMKDADSGQIIAHMNVTCNQFRQGGDPHDYNLAFNLDFQAKDNRVRMTFEDMTMLDKNGAAVGWAYNQITDAKKAEDAKVCLAPVKEGILRALQGANDYF